MQELFDTMPLWAWIVCGAGAILYVGFTIAEMLMGKKSRQTLAERKAAEVNAK